MKIEIIDNRYRIEEELGRGSIGLVYKATDIANKETVAVKILHEEIKERKLENILRFRREATTMVGLYHPGIAKVYTIGEVRGINYIVMEFIKGKDLGKFVEEGKRIPIIQALELTQQIAGALAYVHTKGIIHRDLKPGNIMMQENGEKPTAKILDFGLARLISIDEITETKIIVGTFPYMSPEQIGLMDRPIDERSDLYSLGVIMYRIITGQLPFTGEDIGSLIHQHLAKVPMRPRDLNSEIPVMVDKIIMKLLHKEMKDRYQSAKGLIYDLEKAGELIRNNEIESEFKTGLGDKIKGLSYRTKFVGRDRELGRLKIAVDKVVSGMGAIEFIGGEAGIGKSRICSELKDYIREKGAISLSGRSYEYGNIQPYNPFREAIDELINYISKFDRQRKRIFKENVVKITGELGQLAAEFSPPLKEVLEKTVSISRLEPLREKERFLNVISDLFIGIARYEAPLILILEDLQWSDESSLELLHRLALKMWNNPVLIIGTYRTEELDTGHPLYKLTDTLEKESVPMGRHELAPLDIADCKNIVGEMLGQEIHEIKGWDNDILLKTQGNPFFIGEMIRNLAESEVLYLDEGAWNVSLTKMEKTEISSTITDTVLKRINRLTKDGLEVFTMASAIGKDFTFRVLLDIVAQDADKLLDILDEGLKLRLIIESGRPTKKGYSFVHDKIREVLNSRIDKSIMPGIHLRIGESLEKEYAAEKESVICEMADHFIKSGNRGKIIQYGLKAGQRAKSLHANQDARYFYEAVLSCISFKSPEYKEVIESLADVYVFLGECKKAIETCNKALSVAVTKSDKARIEGKIGGVYFKENDLLNSIKHHRNGLEYLGVKLPETNAGVACSIVFQLIIQLFHTLFPGIFLGRKKTRPEDPHWDALRILWRITYTYWYIDRNRCLDVHLRALNMAELLGESPELAAIYSNHGVVVSSIPLFKRAIKYQKKGLAIRENLKDRWGIAYAKAYLGGGYYYASQWDKAIKYSKEAYEELERLGDPWENSFSVAHLTFSYFNKGEIQESERYSKKTYELYKSMGNPMIQGLGFLARMKYIQGNTRQAMEIIEDAVKIGTMSYDHLALAVCLKDAGYVYLENKDYGKAMALVQKGVDLITKHHLRCDYFADIYTNLTRCHMGKLLNFGDMARENNKAARKEAGKSLKKGINWAKKYRNHLGYAYRVAGQFYWALGKRRKSFNFMKKSIRILQKLGARYELGLTYYELGRMLTEM